MKNIIYSSERILDFFYTQLVLPIIPNWVYKAYTLSSDDGRMMTDYETGSQMGGSKNCFSRCWRHLFPSMKQRNAVFKQRIATMVKSKSMYWVVMFLVTMNTISVSLKWYGMPDEMDKKMKIVEIIFTFIFIIEMIIRMYGLGFESYFKSKFNTFDCIVIIASLIEQFYMMCFAGPDMGLTVFRCLRLLRLFKVTRYWTSLRNLAHALLNSLKSIVSLLFLLFLFLLIFALLGMQLFGGMFVFAEQVPRVNFDNFLNALLTVFQILTGEDWNLIMYNAINAKGGVTGQGKNFHMLLFSPFSPCCSCTTPHFQVPLSVSPLAFSFSNFPHTRNSQDIVIYYIFLHESQLKSNFLLFALAT